MKVIKIGISLIILVNAAVNAKVILPPVIDHNMVLQQKTNAALWGKASPAAKVKITTSWNGKSYSAQTGSDSLWRVSVSTPAAGGPFDITFDDGEKLILKNILVGEVWVCSGQSNMSMPVKGFKNQPVAGSDELLQQAENPNIRLMQIQRQYSVKPEFDGKVIPWTAANMQSVSEFSAVGYIYAKILQEKLKVPIGIIMTAWGGTKIEAWMSPGSISSLSFIKQPLIKEKTKISHNSPSVLYHAMVNPIAGYAIKGIIWYQGEANRSNYQQYDQLMQAMVKGWRKAWNIGEWPFYYVQIAPFKYDGTNNSAFLREAQLKASALIPNSGMVVSLDVGKEAFIHAPDKVTIGKRLSLWALANNYGMTQLAHASPVYKSIHIRGDIVEVDFDHAINGLSTFGKDLTGFEVAGMDKEFYPATAKITSKGVKVFNEKVKKPVAVRYAFKDWVIGSLYNTEGLPVSSFRTDTW
ncbi:sialate O-acetylesterase [Pedobacter heparinus]|uniref:sialate O-acetylesterase n=1 Tax=Pedobacter heparinus TaxID=984 RepID=UPI0029308E90|nr:sialate O-acetylesterase [Pedobacter heparinus]